MMNAPIVAQAQKKISQVATLLIEILPDGKNIRWYFSSTDLNSSHEPETAVIQYDYQEVDEELEPKPFIEISGAKHYLDSFVLVE
jgi:hypothetical protein